ncbi:hypothetical protein BH09ACT7_BH09ACT7_49930 [soil metagenome]
MSDRRPHEAATTRISAPPDPGDDVPARPNRVRDGVAVALLVAALLLPWSIEFGVGVPGSNGLLFAIGGVVTLLAIAAALIPHVGPWQLTSPHPEVRRATRARFWLGIAYVACVLGFVGFHLVETVRDGGTGEVPPGAGPGMWLGLAGALLASQPPIARNTLTDNGFGRWYGAVRILGLVSIGLAALSVMFNLFWRLRYLFVADVQFAGEDVAVVVTAVLYGGVAMVALVIGSGWLLQKTPAARLATTALGAATALAGVLVWVAGVGRDIDAFHGIAENTSTAAIGYEGYLAWTAAAAIVAPTTLYAVFLVKPPTLAVYRKAALKCLTLIAFWSFAAAGLRVTDYLIALALSLPHIGYDSFALTVFNLFTGGIAVWLRRQLAKGGLSTTVIAAFSAVLTVFTAAQLVVGVALAPRYVDPVPRSPDAIYGNDVAQQITSTFDVVICALSLAVLVGVLLTGPLATLVLRRRTPEVAEVAEVAAPTTVLTPAPAAAPTTEIPAPTTALRIQRRPRSSDVTTALRIARRPKPPASE